MGCGGGVGWGGGERESLRVCMCKNIQIKVRKMSENYLFRFTDFKVFTIIYTSWLSYLFVLVMVIFVCSP